MSTEAREDISFDAMVKLQAKVADVFAKSPYVAHVAQSVGGSDGGSSAMNNGRLFVELKPKAERPTAEKVLADLRRQLGVIPGINTFMVPVQNLSIGARASKSQYQFVVQASNQDQTNQWAGKLADAMSRGPRLFHRRHHRPQNNALQATLVVDRDKAASLGIDADMLRSTLYARLRRAAGFDDLRLGDSYQVIIELDPRIDWSPERLAEIKVAARQAAALVPLGAFARIERTAGPLTVNQLGQLPAVTISYNLPHGVALGDSVTRDRRAQGPSSACRRPITTTFYGTAKTFEDSLANQGLLILGAILTIYIVLGILYESFVHPLTILTGLPSAAVGALLAPAAGPASTCRSSPSSAS